MMSLMKHHLLRRRDILCALPLAIGLAPLVGYTTTPEGAGTTGNRISSDLFIGRDPKALRPDDSGTQVKVVGVGGSGGRVVKRMMDCGVQGVDFICVDSDINALARCGLATTVPMGHIGRGAAGKPWRGRDYAEVAERVIQEAVAGAHMLFITAGMGGGTGTGASPVIARVAREMGIFTVGVVTFPFDWENGTRMSKATAGIAELRSNVDSLIVTPNDRLLAMMGDDVTVDEAFANADDVLKNAIGGIAEIINVPGHVNVDFEDVRTVMGEPGTAMMGTATASGRDRARVASERALACPLLEGIALASSKGVLVLISASKGSLRLSESKLAMTTIRALASEDAHIIYGTAYDDSLGDDIRVTVVAGSGS